MKWRLVSNISVDYAAQSWPIDIAFLRIVCLRINALITWDITSIYVTYSSNSLVVLASDFLIVTKANLIWLCQIKALPYNMVLFDIDMLTLNRLKKKDWRQQSRFVLWRHLLMSSCTLMDGVGTGDVILLPVILLPAIVIVKLVWLPGIIVWADADILLEFIRASTLTTNSTATIVTSRVKICFIAYIIRSINSKIVRRLFV